MRDEAMADDVRDAAVAMVVDARAEYLASGAMALKHWDQIHAALVMAMRVSDTAEQMVTAFRRSLRLGAPSSNSACSIARMAEAMDADARSWIAMLEEESGYVIAAARREAERRSAARAEAEGKEA